MRVIYGANLNEIIDDNSDPKEVFDTIAEQYTELASNGTYEVSNEDGEQVMRIGLRRGSKA